MLSWITFPWPVKQLVCFEYLCDHKWYYIVTLWWIQFPWSSLINIKFSLLNPRLFTAFFMLYLVTSRASRLFSAFFMFYLVTSRASRYGLSLYVTIMSPVFVLYDASILDFFISFATVTPEISSIFLLPYYSSWFLLIFSSSNSLWSSFSVLLMRVPFFLKILFSASIVATSLP